MSMASLSFNSIDSSVPNMRMKLVVKVDNMETNLMLLQNDNNSLTFQEKHKVLQKIKVDLCGSNNSTSYNDKLLSVLGPELRQETRHTGIILEILTVLLPNLKDDVTFTQLTEIAGSILDLLISTMKFKAESFHVSCVNVLLLYHFNALVLVMETYSDKLLALLDQEIAEENVKTFILQLTKRCLSVQSQDVKSKFTEKGISVWFSRIVPILFSDSRDFNLSLEIIELLIPYLHIKNYNENVNFQTFVAHIQDKVYPCKIIAKLQSPAHANWDRVWICCARLLGRNMNRIHTTINPLLLVLETAFKMDNHRLNGFKCWKVLIDMFSKKELHARIKLLSVPFTHVNVKPNVVSTKLDIWLYLLNLLRPNLEPHAELLLLPFVHFCFGAKQGRVSLYRYSTVASYPALNVDAINALVEIFGHSQCDSCQSDMKKSDAMITAKMFSDYLDDWKYSIYQGFKLIISTLENENRTSIKDATCLFSSFLYFTKSGYVKDVLDLIQDIDKEHRNNTSVWKLMTNVLIPLTLDEDKGFSPSTLTDKTLYEGSTPLIIITNILVSNNINSDSAISDLLSLGGKFNILVQYIAEQDDPTYILHQLRTDPFGTHLYISLIKLLFDRINENSLCYLFLWPANKLHSKESIGDIVEAWSTAFVKHNISNELNDRIIKGMMLGMNISNISIFLLPIALSKRLISKPDWSVRNDDVCIFAKALHQLRQWKANSLILNLSKYVLLFIETSMRIKIINFLSKESLIFIARFVITVITFCSDDVAEILGKIIDKIYFMASNNFDSVFGVLEACANNSKLKPLQEKALTKISTLLSNKTFTPSEKQKLKELLEVHKNNISTDPCVQLKDLTIQLKSNDKVIMKPPNLQNKSNVIKCYDKNKEDLIIIPPKWKFNPNKLTEHQKEKFKQRREDIPALYQDMSQSHDDNSLQSWQPNGYRTDSQDTSNETKNTTKKAEKILQDIPNSDVCPNIINTLLVSMSPKNGQNVMNDKSASNIKDKIFLNDQANVNQDKPKKNLDFLHAYDAIDNIILSPNPADDLKLIETKTLEANKANRVYQVSTIPTEKERPMRVKKKPKKFDPEDHVITKIRKSSDLNGEKCTRQIQHSSELGAEAQEIMKNEILPDVISDTYDVDKFHSTKNNSPNIIIEAIPNNNKIHLPKETKKSIMKRKYKIKSRLESQLQIDMVEGHPLEKINTKRSRFNKTISSCQTKADLNTKQRRVLNRRNSMTITIQPNSKYNDNSQILDKCSKNTTNIEKDTDKDITPEIKDLTQEPCHQIELSNVECTGTAAELTQRQNSCLSEDVIESSQDSTSSSSSIIRARISVTKSIQSNLNEKVVHDNVIPQNDFDDENRNNKTNNYELIKNTFNESKETDINNKNTSIIEGFSDKHQESIIPSNLPVTAEIDTELVTTQEVENILEKDLFDNIKEALHQDVNTKDTEIKSIIYAECDQDVEGNITCGESNNCLLKKTKEETTNDIVSVLHLISSPQKDDTDKRTTDFLNSTLDMSPIKACTQIDPDNTITDIEEINVHGPTETSPDVFSVEKVLSGENIEICNDSPPSCALITTSSSPCILTSYKKNRPNVTSRGAQMLGLCVPDKVGTLQFSNGVNAKTKNNPTGNSVPNRNFKMVYNSSSDNIINDDMQISIGNNTSIAADEGLISEVPLNLLIFSKVLPDPHASPSGSILKRKRDDALEDVSSPASKKKRVSFHDPPVSTTKYIERPSSPVHNKSPKPKLKIRMLNSYFEDISPLDNDQDDDDDDTQATNSPLEKSYNQACIKNSVLNNDEPIYRSLISCNDKISNITAQLASPLWENCMREELRGKVKTVGEFASLTEYEVSLLSIKFPKIDTARSVLSDYFCKWQQQIANDQMETTVCVPVEKPEEENTEDPTIPLTPSQSKPKTCDASQNTYTGLSDASQNTDPDPPADENDSRVQSFMDNHSLNDIIDIYIKRQERTNDNFMSEMTEGTSELIKKILSLGKDNPSTFLKHVIAEYSANAILESLPDEELLKHVVQNNSVSKVLHLLGKTLDHFENK